MNINRNIISILAFIILSFNSIQADTLNQVIQKGMKNSPFLRIYLYKTKSVEGEIKSSKQLPNPEMDIEFGRLYSQKSGDSGLAITTLTISQPLRIWGEREFSVKSAKFKKFAYQKLYEYQKNVLISKIYKQFYLTLFIKEKIKVKKKELNNLENLYRFMEKSYRFGEITKLDLLRVEREISLAKIELEKLEGLFTAELLKLSSLVGTDIKDVEGDFFTIPKAETVNLHNLPEIEYYSYLIKSVQEGIKREKALGKPNIRLGFITEEDSKGKYQLGLTLSSTIPVLNRNRGKVLELIYKEKSLLEKRKFTQLMYKSEIEALERQINTLKRQVNTIKTETLPTIEKSLKLAEKSYRLKTITYFEFSNVRKQYYDTLYYQLELLNEIHQLYGNYLKFQSKNLLKEGKNNG